MRVAVISDVHGNAYALEAVLAEIAGASSDAVINLGDQIEGAADPLRAYQMQAALGATEVRGNNEEKLWPGGRRGRLSAAYGAWLEQQFAPSELSRLAALPLTARLGPLLACHGTTTSAWDSLLWAWSPAQGAYLSRDPRELRTLLAGLGAEVVVCGHTHRPGSTLVGNTLLVNAGAVSDQVDGDPRARWTLLEKRAGQWSAAFHAVKYDVQAAAEWGLQHSPFGAGQAELLKSGEMTVRGDSPQGT